MAVMDKPGLITVAVAVVLAPMAQVAQVRLGW
jgi:hypothetical protein